MMRTKSQFPSAVEHAIAHSMAHWSEVAGPSDLSETSESSVISNSYYEEVDRENEEVFAELMNNPQWTFSGRPFFLKAAPYNFKLGRKIAEGGQGEIFEVIFLEDPKSDDDVNVLKVFKRGLRLSDLKQEWPSVVLQGRVERCLVYLGLLLEDGRFGFLMLRCSCDLRTLIDKAMEEKNNQGPPFPYKWKQYTLTARYLLEEIVDCMMLLHRDGVVHRDLKAANVLMLEYTGQISPIIADYECSLAVVGTGFWMAPEILLALKERKVIKYTEAIDVYSYGMLCFEVVTGRLPFEGELQQCRANYDLVIAGQRPQLPSDLDLTLKHVIESCWHPNPGQRPSFSKILEVLNS